MEKLKEEWLEFAGSQETNRAKEAFRNNLPTLEGDMITVDVSNVLDVPLLKKIGAKLIKVLKEVYSIRDLHLTVKKIASTTNFEKPKSESADDRVKKMIAENTAFADFVKRFQLEVDY